MINRQPNELFMFNIYKHKCKTTKKTCKNCSFIFLQCARYEFKEIIGSCYSTNRLDIITQRINPIVYIKLE